MLHLLYILAFTVLAFLAVGNLIRNLITLGADAQRGYGTRSRSGYPAGAGRNQGIPHPELLDDTGKVINEPLLVMRSISVDDAREQLDALFKSSPGGSEQNQDDN